MRDVELLTADLLENTKENKTKQDYLNVKNSWAHKSLIRQNAWYIVQVIA